jgi:hypothetical protein
LIYSTDKERNAKNNRPNGHNREGDKVKQFTKWNEYAKRARRMNQNELEYAMKDCMECIKVGCDVEFYSDEASVYRQELIKRGIRSIY